MPDRDATLDAFITPDAETDRTEEGHDPDQEPEADETESNKAQSNEAASVETPDEDESSGDEPETDRVTERAETTFAWSPDALACETCGGETHRRWRTDDGFVCPDCVDWERAPEH